MTALRTDMAPLASDARTSRLLAWTEVPAASVGAVVSAPMTVWETLDQGRWWPRALRCWRTATFEPAPLDQNPDEPYLEAGEALLQSLVWLACVDQALSAFPDLDHLTMEPQGRPRSPGGPSLVLPPVLLWRTMRSMNGWLVTEDVALPDVDDMFAGFKPALASTSPAVLETVHERIRRLGRKESGGRFPADGLSRQSLPHRAAEALGQNLRTLVRQHEERRVLHATLDGEPIPLAPASPVRRRL